MQRSGIDTIKSHTCPSHIWESDKNTRKHHTKESQEVKPFPAGNHKASKNRQDSIIITNVKLKQQKGSTKEAPPWNDL